MLAHDAKTRGDAPACGSALAMSRSANAPRLAPAGTTHASFDVFGTCLIRTVGGPSELYRVVALQLAARLQIPRPEEFAEDFVEWRTEAERRARRRLVREEVRLEDIWRELHVLIGPAKLAGNDGPALEMEAERGVLRPIIATRARVAAERSAGRRILFISDSCLPAAFLASLLREHGFALEVDTTYVSSEIGLTKRTGTLFRHVLNVVRLEPASVHHIGDDPIADFEAPKRLGLSVELFTASRPRSMERLLLWQRPPNASRWMATAGALTATRLTHADEMAGPERSPVEKFVEQFLGPFFCVYGHWLLRQAKQDGVKRLYFASRDTRLLWRACEGLENARGLDLRYLMISRQAVMLPSIEEISPAGLAWLRRDFEQSTLPRLLAKMELRYEDCAADWLTLRPGWRPEMPLASPLEWVAFWRLLAKPRISEQIAAQGKIRRENARAYFGKMGLLDSVPKGFVDLGWFLTTQSALSRLCRTELRSPPIRGYYLALKRFRMSYADAGPASAIFRESADDMPLPLHLRWLRRNYLVEQIAGLADHPSVKAYGIGGSIEFVPSSQTTYAEPFPRIEETVVAYVSKFGACWEHLGQDDEQVAWFLGTLLNELFAHPSGSCVRLFQAVRFSPDPGRENTERLIQPYSWLETLLSWTGSSRHSLGWRWWPEASTAATPPARRIVREQLLSFPR